MKPLNERSLKSMAGTGGIWRTLRSQWDVQLMIIPAIVFIFIFNYIPLWGLTMSFQDFNLFRGFWGSEWVGLKHFDQLFRSDDFWQVMRNTFVISGLRLLVGFPAPILLALLLNEVTSSVYKRFVQTITYLPHFLSWVIVGGFVGSLLSVDNGSINIMLEKLKLIDEPLNWLSIPEYFWGILVTTGLWKEIGFSSIVYLAAISGIDPHLYEAASIDGANRFKQIFKVTLPSIAPVITIFMILAVGNTLNAGFEDILVLTNNMSNGILLQVADTLDTYVYRVGISSQRFSYATAAGLFKAVVNVALLVAANRIARKFGGTSLW